MPKQKSGIIYLIDIVQDPAKVFLALLTLIVALALVFITYNLTPLFGNSLTGFLSGQFQGEMSEPFENAAGALNLALMLFGVLLASVVLILGNGAISRMVQEEIRGGQKVSPAEAFHFIKRHFASMIFLPIIQILVGFCVLAVVFTALSLVYSLNYIGPIISALLYLPLSLIALFTLIYLAVSMSMIPPIVISRESGFADTFARVFRGFTKQMGRFIFLEFAALVSLPFMVLYMLILSIHNICTYGLARIGLVDKEGSQDSPELSIRKLHQTATIPAQPTNAYLIPLIFVVTLLILIITLPFLPFLFLLVALYGYITYIAMQVIIYNKFYDADYSQFNLDFLRAIFKRQAPTRPVVAVCPHCDTAIVDKKPRYCPRCGKELGKAPKPKGKEETKKM